MLNRRQTVILSLLGVIVLLVGVWDSGSQLTYGQFQYLDRCRYPQYWYDCAERCPGFNTCCVCCTSDALSTFDQTMCKAYCTDFWFSLEYCPE